jgi:hypothetical protein
MYTGTDRQEAIFRAREALEILEEDPMSCIECSDTVEDTMLDYQMSWTMLGATEEEYQARIKKAAIRTAREYFDRVCTSGKKHAWLKLFEKVVYRFRLGWDEIGIKKTDYLRQRLWHARLDRIEQITPRTGTHG